MIKYIFVILVSMAPIVELRGAMPIGMGMGLDPKYVFIASLLGNIIAIPFILLLLEPIFKFLERWSFFKKIIDKTKNNVSVKFKKARDKYGPIALIIFVAIPLPGSGAWSGALAAKLFGIDNKVAFISIAIGVLIAGIIVGGFSYSIFG